MNVLDLSEYVIRHAHENEKSITNLKLQKTLYYLQGYSLRCFDECAFDEIIKNWQYGPVAPMAYFEYSIYGAYPLEENPCAEAVKLDKSKKKLFDAVIDKCLQCTARELVRKTHTEAPWKDTVQNEEIKVQNIKKYFCAHNPLELDDEEIA